MLDKYKEKQPFFYRFMMSSYNNDKLSHAYLIETKNVNYSFDLAIDLAKFFLCNGEFNEEICDAVDNDSYEGFKIVENDKEIKIEQIDDLKYSFSLTGDKNRKVYIIKDATAFNKTSANGILTFLEEPKDGIIAILLADNADRVIETIRSRCQIVNLVNNKDNNFDYKSVFFYYDNDRHGDYEEFIKKETDSFYNFYFSLEHSSCDFLVNFECYDFTDRIKSLLIFGIYLYKDILTVKLDLKKRYFNDLDLEDFVQNNEISVIIEKIDVISDFLYKASFNVNLKLFIDNFVICMKGVNK